MYNIIICLKDKAENITFSHSQNQASNGNIATKLENE